MTNLNLGDHINKKILWLTILNCTFYDLSKENINNILYNSSLYHETKQNRKDKLFKYYKSLFGLNHGLENKKHINKKDFIFSKDESKISKTIFPSLKENIIKNLIRRKYLAEYEKQPQIHIK